MEKLLIYQDGASNKFWKINVTGNSYTVTYGKVGTVGAVKSKKFDSREMCEKEADKLVRSKLKKGYRPAEADEQVIKESTMTEELFWELLEAARKKGEDPDEQVEWLVGQLSRKPIKDIIMFDFYFNRNYKKSYTSDLWAAAYIVMGGCSDDCFDYFRAWLLCLGKEAYEAGIRDPQSILPFFERLEEEDEVPQFEEILYAAGLAYEEKTDQDEDQYYELYVELTGDVYEQQEIEFDWDDEDEEVLKKKFPLLWERFGENPLEY